jgi:hypothetical protein
MLRQGACEFIVDILPEMGIHHSAAVVVAHSLGGGGG